MTRRPSAAERPGHLVITVHGIRTFGGWASRLAGLVRSHGGDVEVASYVYGYFSALAFAFPPVRWLAVRRFQRWLEAVSTTHPDARVDVVSHSFGTYLVAWALHGLAKTRRPHVDTIILAGSVLKSSFRWERLLASGSVRRVVNDCGTRDVVLVLSQLLVLFTGMAGRIGFIGMTGPGLSNRFHDGGHSLYFSDDFMRAHWVPLLTGDSPVAPIDARPPLHAFGGIRLWLVQNLEPFKLVAYGVLIAAPLWNYYSLARTLEQQRQVDSARRLMGEVLSPASPGSEFLPRRLLLAIESWQTAPTPEAEAFLRRAVDSAPVARGRFGDRPVVDVAVSVDSAGAATVAEALASRARAIRLGGATLLMAYESAAGVLALGAAGHVAESTSTGVTVTDITTGEVLARIPFSSSLCPPVARLALSREGSSIAIAGTNGEFLVWDVGADAAVIDIDVGERFDPDVDIARVNCIDEVKAMAFSSDGRLVAAANPDGRVIVRQVETGRATTVVTDRPVQALDFHPAGDLLATGGPDGYLTVWDWRRRRELAVARHEGAIRVVRFNGAGNQLLTASEDGTARLWSLASMLDAYEYRRYREEEAGQRFREAWQVERLDEHLRMSHDGPVTAATLSDDGTWFATVSGGSAYVWHRPSDADTQTGGADLVAQACRRLTRNLTPAEWRQFLGSAPYRATCPTLADGVSPPAR